MKTAIIALAVLFSAVLASPIDSVADLTWDVRDNDDSTLRCLYDLWFRIKDLDKTHKGVRDFARDVYETYQDLQENKRLCDSLEKENPNWFERIAHQTCVIGYQARRDFEYTRLTIESRRVFAGDFWIQLFWGLDGCFRD